MSEELKLYLIMCIKNILIVIAFVILAIAFNKWWLSLFSMLFWSYIDKNNEKGE